MARGRRAAKLAAGLVLAATLAACGGNRQKEVPLEDLSAEQIYQKAEFELENSRKPEELSLIHI